MLCQMDLLFTDLASQGGNSELTEPDKIIDNNGVKNLWVTLIFFNKTSSFCHQVFLCKNIRLY